MTPIPLVVAPDASSVVPPVEIAPAAAMLSQIEARCERARATHLGYPYNLAFEPLPPAFAGYLVNNLGDPYAGSHYASEVCDLERDVVRWLMGLWQASDEREFWGSVGTSGTEGNFWAIYLGREFLPGAVLLHSEEAHYSIPKAARILSMTAVQVACAPSGEIDLDDLSAKLAALGGRPVVLALTCGTTMKGAHDDIEGAIARLDDAGLHRERRFVHVDGALNAMVLPFASGAPAGRVPSFATAIDSVSTSGHKMIGTPMPCGVLVCRRRHVERVASAIAYLRSNDTTLMGSRNGHAVLALWVRLFGHGRGGYERDVETCVARASRLASRLERHSVPVLHNAFGLTVVFPQPDETIVKRYQLACYRGEAHAIVMPNVGNDLLDQFVEDYLSWWTTSRNAQTTA